MASTRRRPRADLSTRLAREPWRFDALQAYRLLESLDGQPPQLAGRIRRHFPASEVAALSRIDGRARLEIAAFALGDILPDAYLELLRRADAQDLRAFLAPFDQRLQRLRLDQQALLTPSAAPNEALAQALGALLGLTPGTLPDAGALRITAGLLGRRPASLEAIERLAAWHLGIAVRARPFAGRRIELPVAARTRLGRGGKARQLGQNALLGSRAWNASAAIRLTAGPIELADVEDFSARQGPRLIALAEFAAGPALSVSCDLAIAPGSITTTPLNGTRRLHQTSFLGAWRRADAPIVGLPNRRRAA